MNAAEKRILLPLLKRVKAGETPSFRMRSAAEHLIYRFSKPASKSKKAARVRKEGKRAEHRDSTAVLRERVLQRAAGRCECQCGAYLSDRAEMDHYYGRARGQSVETVWMLDPVCHRDKTDNRPGRAFWELKFRAHCVVHGYEFRPRIVKEIP